MARTSLCGPLALAYLFLASALPANAQNAGDGGGTGVSAREEEPRVSVSAGAPLEVECRLRPEQRAEWQLEGAPLPADLQPSPEAAAPDGRLAARLHTPAARAYHAGLYTCTADGRRGPRVRVVVLSPPDTDAAAAAATLAPTGAATDESPAAAGEESDGKETLFDVRSNITLTCALLNADGLPYVWTKNDTNIEQVSDLKGRYKLERGGAELVVAHSVEDDFGNYTCALSGREDTQSQRWMLRGRTFAKLPANSNVVEGQKLKLQCKVVGKPYPRVVWTVSNSTDEEAEGVEVRAALGERVTLRRSEQGAEDGELVVEAVQRADAGRYACAAPVPGASAPPHRAATTLHVKDMYAALWPFLGICAEVFVLCAIILVYEKRRTKPDLDDSDTDNHDQKKS